MWPPLLALLFCAALAAAHSELNRRTLSSSSSSCDFDFKVYVYPLPETLPSVSLAEEARRNGSYHVCVGCIYEQFALEYIVMDFFTQFCGRTYDPYEADFFYLPIVRDVEFRIQKLVNNNKKPSLTEIALLQTMEKNNTKLWKSLFQITDYFWHRHGGADHIIAMPAPVTNLRHESSRRGFFHYMMHLHSPIFLNIEYSKTFVNEYPMCSQYKNIVMPYPSIDPAIFNGKFQMNKKPIEDTSSIAGQYNKSLLLFYRGGNHGECMVIRQALTRLMNELVGKSRKASGRLSSSTKHKTGYLNSLYCPVPVGDSPSSKRMYDAMHVGCIPVILSDDLVWAYSTDTGGNLSPRLFSIAMPQKVVLTTLMQLYQGMVLGGAGGEGAGEEESEADSGSQKPSDEAVHSLLRALGQASLPSGTSLRRLVDMAIEKATAVNQSHSGISLSSNSLVAMLQVIPQRDVELLQRNVRRFAPEYQYYEVNASLSRNPLALKVPPTGGAITRMAAQLSARKRRGVEQIRQKCEEEKSLKHKYIGKYPCDTLVKGESSGQNKKHKGKGRGHGGKNNKKRKHGEKKHKQKSK